MVSVAIKSVEDSLGHLVAKPDSLLQMGNELVAIDKPTVIRVQLVEDASGPRYRILSCWCRRQ